MLLFFLTSFGCVNGLFQFSRGRFGRRHRQFSLLLLVVAVIALMVIVVLVKHTEEAEKKTITDSKSMIQIN